MSGELPAGWMRFSLKDLGGLSGGKTPSKANSEFWSSRDVPWVSPKDMKKNQLEDAEDSISQIAVDEAGMTLYPAGSVLMVTRSGILQHTFPVALAGAELTVNQDIKVLRPIAGIAPKFSFYMLKSFGGEILSACSKDGTTVQSIDSDKLEAFPFPLPPLAEQTRIAAKLDELLAQVDTLKARIDGIPALLKRFRQSVLAAAISGRLTEEWRKERALPEFSEVELGHLIKEGPQNGLYKPSSAYGSGVKIIRIDGFYSGEITGWEGLRSLEVDLRELESWGVREGDILINRVNSIEYLGKCALVRSVPEPTVYESNIMRMSLKSDLVHPEYLMRFLSSEVGRKKLISKAKHAVNQASINQGDVKACKVPLPSVEEQTEIVRRVEQLFAFADQLEAKVKEAKTRIDRLTQSILAKAFRGELVAQHPSDEPASELLARIQAQRASAPKAKRGRKKAENP